MTPAQIADEIARVLDFPGTRKHVAIAVDRAVLEEAVNALRLAARTGANAE